MKTIFRTNNKTGNYTCISNSILQSETLTPDEIGVLVRLLSLPENFVINKTSIWKTMKIGREHFNKVWNNLVKTGYVHTIKKIDTKSKHFEYTHTIHEIPFPQDPVHQIPVPQEPVNGKLVSLIIDNKKETEKNKEEKNKEEKENGEFGTSTGPDTNIEKEKTSTEENTGSKKILGENPLVDVSLSLLPEKEFVPSLNFHLDFINLPGEIKKVVLSEWVKIPKETRPGLELFYNTWE